MERVLAHVTAPAPNAATDTASGKTTPPGTSAGATSPADGAASAASNAHPFSALGNSAALFLMPLSMGNMSGGGVSPNSLMAIELKDASAFQPAFEAWIAHLKSLDPELKVENKPYHKLQMYTFSRTPDAASAGEQEKGPTSSLHPTLVIMPDRILLAPSRTYAQSEVRRIEAGGEVTNALMREGAIQGDAFEVAWTDWGTLVGKLYDLARGFLPLMMQGSKNIIDLSKLPTAAELFRYIQPSTSYSAHVDGKLYKRSVTSLGPETPLMFVALAVAVSIEGQRKAAEIASSAAVLPGVAAADNGAIHVGHVVSSTGEIVTPNESAKDAEHKATLSALRDVKTGLAVYRSQFGRVPDTLDELLKATDAFPNGFLDGGVVPKDGWQHPLVYSVQEKGAKFDLRSCGPNGVDDHGTGDDVTLP
jgi:hypothetical protein